MSYLHCPTCSRAYCAATHRACPACPRDPVADIVEAARTLARAIERATTEQLLLARHALRGERTLALLAPPSPPPAPRKPTSLFARARLYLAAQLAA